MQRRDCNSLSTKREATRLYEMKISLLLFFFPLDTNFILIFVSAIFVVAFAFGCEIYLKQYSFVVNTAYIVKFFLLHEANFVNTAS